MSKENQPLPYERRIRETKSLAQRLDLNYIHLKHWLRSWRRTLSIVLPLAALLACLPLILGVGKSETAFVNGPISRSHRIFEQRCDLCHQANFTSVRDQDCKACHDGPSHQAAALNEPRCASCHGEHQGTLALASLSDRNCTGCHSDLAAHARSPKTKHLRITGFSPGNHPEFSVAARQDARPLKLNHALHLPAAPKTIRGIKLPMKCVDCHQIDLDDPKGGLMTMTFDRHCASCHKRELEFDVYGVLGASAPAPHLKDPNAIRDIVRETYTSALRADAAIARKPLRPDVEPPATSQAWLTMAIRDSQEFLFRKKCGYCHQIEGWDDGLPRIAKVNRLRGRFTTAKPEGEPWMPKTVFGHRAHRMVQCASCHAAAKQSRNSSDVLIAGMASCLSCHGKSSSELDNCAQCHLYHDKSKERDQDRKSIDEILSASAHGTR